jgi:hypothetical protein
MKKARETVIALLGVISTRLAAGNGKRRSLALITDPDLQAIRGLTAAMTRYASLKFTVHSKNATFF